MKHLYRFSLILNIGLVGFMGYSYAKDFFYPEIEQVETTPQINNITVVAGSDDDIVHGGKTLKEEKANIEEDTSSTNTKELKATEQENITVSSTENKTTCDTVLEIETFNVQTNETELAEETIPEQYIGKTRKELESIISSYSESPSLSDLEKGFASMELKNFSPEKIVVTKNYYARLKNENFYLMVENEYVNVYYNDLKTVYLYTDIKLSQLPEDIQQEIMDKKLIKTEEELYNFLESYSS